MNFSQLQCFVSLADSGSFTETAYATHLTQSAVSHALAALERELGVTLLERNNKGVVAPSRTTVPPAGMSCLHPRLELALSQEG